MKKLFETLQGELQAGRPAMMVTVIAGSGSTPRGAGARMLVGRGGRITGTIGGGAVEYRAETLAVEALEKGESYTKAFTLRPNEIEDLGMVCGGDVKVFLQYIPATPQDIAFTAKVQECFDGSQNAWLLYDITDETAWQMGLYTPAGGLRLMAGRGEGGGLAGLSQNELDGLLGAAPMQRQLAGRLYYSEPFVRAGRVIVFGGGHVAQELVPVLAHLDFRCVVVDDRPEFTRPELFPGADRVILGDLSNIKSYLALTPSDYIVVMTRGHAGDFVVQNQVLRAPAAYYGVIGSRRKIKAVSEKLLAQGIPQAVIDSVYTPIGLDIKAQTPAEIAISIAAELILVRARLAAAAVRAEQEK